MNKHGPQKEWNSQLAVVIFTKFLQVRPNFLGNSLTKLSICAFMQAQ
jgi:hypothetical protein